MMQNAAVRFTRTSLVLLLLVTMASVVVGCRGNKTKGESGKVNSPTARVVGAKLISTTEHGSRIDVMVELENPNTIPLPLIETRYAFTTAWDVALHGKDNPNRTLPAGRKQTVTIPIAVPRAVEVGTAFTIDGSIYYEPPGEVRKLLTESNIPLPRVSFRGEGVIQ